MKLALTGTPSQVLGEVAAQAARAPASLGLEALYASKLEFVRRAVSHLAGPELEAEDLVQEVFAQAARRLDAFEGRSAIDTWLYGIAMRVAANARRRAKFRRLLMLQVTEEPRRESTGPDEALESAQRKAAVYRALDRLSEKKRMVLVLHELEGVAGEQVAEIVGCPVATVWTRLFHARKEFARAYAAEMQAERGGEP